MKLGKTKLKLAKAVSLNTAQAEELANLKVALEACENKWYNEGFADAENSIELVIQEARIQGGLVGCPTSSRGPQGLSFKRSQPKSLSRSLLLPYRILLVLLTRKSHQA